VKPGVATPGFTTTWREVSGLGAARSGILNGVSPLAAGRGASFWIKMGSGIAALAIVAAGCLAVGYRYVYNTWPGQGASDRLHWCGRNYDEDGAGQTWRQVVADQGSRPVHAAGQYPPLGWSRQEVFAETSPDALGSATTCGVVIYLRTGPDGYRPYELSGGP
jgi:hypothetical protein